MNYGVYAIRDIKTGFLPAQVDVNDQSAVRNFEHAVLGNKDSLFFSHPEDYALFSIGQYDTESGKLTPELPTEIISAWSVMSRALERKKEVMVDGEKS